MVIEKLSVRNQIDWLPVIRTIGLSVFVLSLTIPAFLIVLGSVANPTGSPLSPLPSGEMASQLPAQSAPAAGVANNNFASSLNLAQNYLDKAFAQAKNPEQTSADKKQIIDNLNLSLNYVTSAINQNNSDPRGYLMRAQILTAISKVKPEALKEAQADLEIASKLSNGATVQLPTTVNPINLIPDERAQLAENVIVAGPNDATQTSIITDQGSNSFKKTVVLPANQSEMTITDNLVKESSFIYLIPNGKAQLTVKSKAAGTFVIENLTPQTTDLSLDYWIINQ